MTDPTPPCTHPDGVHDLRPGPTAFVHGRVGAIRVCAFCHWIAPGVVTVDDPFEDTPAEGATP